MKKPQNIIESGEYIEPYTFEKDSEAILFHSYLEAHYYIDYLEAKVKKLQQHGVMQAEGSDGAEADLEAQTLIIHKIKLEDMNLNEPQNPQLQQTAVSCSFAFGECVKVLHCFHGHEFEIGEIVCIVGKSDYDDAWLCRNAKGVEWYLHDEEGEVVNCG